MAKATQTMEKISELLDNISSGKFNATVSFSESEKLEDPEIIERAQRVERRLQSTLNQIKEVSNGDYREQLAIESSEDEI
ncbi:MAG: hypothetical protein HRU15_20110, partial [Planctomycetes bacterium]|nr:hypothetical protein [Planctomycetota bacterium]